MIFLAPAEADTRQAKVVKESLAPLVEKAGFRWDQKSSLIANDLEGNIPYVISLAPNPDLPALVKTAPAVHFLAIGFQNLADAPNLVQINLNGIQPDRQGFMAGIMAAMNTTDWRVAAITIADRPGDAAARLGFLNGVRFFCGLCRPVFPPFTAYPLAYDYPAQGNSEDIQAVVQFMTKNGVKTVFIYGGAGGAALLDGITKSGIEIIGTDQPSGSYQKYWVASVSYNLQPTLELAWEKLQAGSASNTVQLPLEITNINNALISPGRLQLAQKYLTDLQTGSIDTGVDPQTGESR